MIKLNLYKQSEDKEEHVDIYYSKMNPSIKKVINFFNHEQRILWGKFDDETVSIPIIKIYYIESVDRKTFAYMKDNVLEIDNTLIELEDMLTDYGFVRVSKSYIVNIYKIIKLKPEVNMKICATFENGEKIYINRSYKKSFNDYLIKMKR